MAQQITERNSKYDFAKYFRLKNNECPICGRKDSGCMAHSELDDYYICTREAMGAEHEFDNTHFGKNYVHKIGGFTFNKPVAKATANNDTPLAATATLNVEYQAIKNKYKLSAADKQYLYSQGIMDTKRYFTLPEPADKSVLAQRLLGHHADGVPGIFKRGDDHFLNLYYWGLAAACYDEQGKIIGIEVRLSEDCKQFHAAKTNDPGKLAVPDKSVYRPLTSPWGAKVKPQQKISAWVNKSSETLWITEGIKKGQVLHDYTNDNVIAVIGVGNWTEAYKMAVRMHKAQNIRRVVLALDMDRFTNPHVGMAHDRLLEYLTEERTMAINVAAWESEYKGIDDLLTEGLWPNIEPVNNEVYQGIDSARAELEERFTDLLRNPNGRMNVFQVSAGVGKTYAIIQAINKLDAEGWPIVQGEDGKQRYMRICMLTDTKDLAYEAQSLFTFGPPVLEGRNDDEVSLFYCASKDKIDLIARAGQNTRKYGCAQCAFKEACEEEYYLASVKMIMSQRFILATKPAIINRSSRLEEFDIVIMDEGIRASLQTEYEVDKAGIELYIKSLRKSKYYHTDKVKELLSIDRSSRKYTDAKEGIRNNERSIKVIEQQIANCEKLLGIMDEPQVGDDYRLQIEFSADYHLSEYVRVDIDDNRWEGIPDGNKKTVFVPPIFYGREKACWRTTKNTILVKCIDTKVVESLSQRTVINLDATPIDEYCKLFAGYTTHKTQVKEQVIIKSIVDRKYAKSQLTKNPDYLEELVYATKQLAAQHATVGVLSTKYIANHLIDAGMPQEIIGWYGKDTRGSNRMRHVDAIIMPGPYIENLSAVDRDAEVLRMAGVYTTRDILIKQITAAETLQAIARGRGVQRTADNPLIVYKLSNQRIAGVRENELYLNIHDLLQNKQAERSTVEEAKSAREQWAKLLLKSTTDHDVQESGANAAIERHEPHHADLYKYQGIAEGGGVHFLEMPIIKQFQDPALFENFLNLGITIKQTTELTWRKFCEAIRDGFTSVKDIAKVMGMSESTVKRLRKAIIAILCPDRCKDTTADQELKEHALAYASEQRHVEVIAALRTAVPDAQLAEHYARVQGVNYPDLRIAYEATINEPDPDFYDSAVEFYWYHAVRVLPNAFEWLCRQFPSMVIDSVLAKQ